MFDAESLSNVLHSIATGFPDRAANLIQVSEQLDDDERTALWEAFGEADGPAAQARRIGDAIRGTGNIDFLSNECYRVAFYLGDGLEALRDDELFNFFRTKRVGRVLDKWVHYFPIYSRYFERFRGRQIKVLEIGVFRGGSIEMWERYFGPEATIVGVDIDPDAVRAAGKGRIIEIGDQSDPDFLRAVNDRHGPFDIIIDDGGHEMEQQIVTAETLFPLLNEGGVFLVEDCHTSYWDSYEGGLRREGTFIEWAKIRVDDLNGYHWQGDFNAEWTNHLDAVHCHDSVIVFEKRARFAPFAEQAGHGDFIFRDRMQALVASELVATRDAAIAERDRARAGQTDSAQLEDEIRILRSELATLRPMNERLERELLKSRSAVTRAHDMVRELRRRGRLRRKPDHDE